MKSDALSNKLTKRDLREIQSLLEEVETSGCAYDMAASWVKGKKRIVGVNRLSDPAMLKHKDYSVFHGRHAELHVYIQGFKSLGFPLKGGTLYITGVRATNSNLMNNTAPCDRCRKIITEETKIKYLVYWLDGKLVKELL